MTSAFERSNHARALCVALMLAAAAACGGDSTPPPEPEPEVTTVRVSIGGFSTDVAHPACPGTNTPVPLTLNQANQVSFRFLGANGQDEPIIVAERANLELRRPTNLVAAWTWSPTGGSGATFTVNITPTSTGSFVPKIDLFNTEHGHNEVECVIRFTVS
jgi:hypothetical protein